MMTDNNVGKQKLTMILVLVVVGLCILGVVTQSIIKSLTPEPTPIRGSY